MPAPYLQLEDLLALAETLRGAGFAIGTQQYIAAHELLVALASRGRLPENPQDWRSLLAPVFCSSRREQEEFAGFFTAWLGRRPNLQAAVQPPRSEAGVVTQQVNVRSSAFRRLRAALSLNRLKAGLRTRLQMLWHWFKRPVIAAATTTLFLSAVGAAAYLSGKTERTLAGNVYALWFLWRWLRRKLIAQKLQTSGTPRLQQLRLAREGVKLFDSPAFRRAVVELRRHRHIAANDLDVAATIRATIRQAGLFTPSFGRRRALPEYLLLIDRASLQDEQARVGDELARRFAAGEIGVERFYFQGDARICQQGPLAPALTLNELAARYPEHRLLIFGDGAGFFDPFSGEPQRWLEQFAQWPERALITPIEPGTQAEPQWGYREAVLQEQGFALLTPTANGFEVLTAWLNTGLAPEPRGTAERPFPAMLAERPIRWMERRAPREEEAERLVAQLRRYLWESGWLWLRACAVYPQVTWELTLYLGARLLGHTPAEREAWGSDLLRLVRLPWFRYSALPDWLRAVLIARFTPPEETLVRGVIEELLRHVLTKPGEAVSLELATRPPGDQRRWRRWLARVEQWVRRRALYRRLQAQPPESQLHDFVFLSFLAGRRLRPLTVQAPKLWERLLFDRGRWVFGLQPVTLGILAAMVAAALWWMFWLKPILNMREPELPMAPSLTAVDTPSFPEILRALIKMPQPGLTPRTIPGPPPRELQSSHGSQAHQIRFDVWHSLVRFPQYINIVSLTEEFLAVVIYGERDFDVETIDIQSVTAGGGFGPGTPPDMYYKVPGYDENHDGIPDMKLGFRISDLKKNGDLLVTSKSLTVRGATQNTKQLFKGVQSISVMP